MRSLTALLTHSDRRHKNLNDSQIRRSILGAPRESTPRWFEENATLPSSPSFTSPKIFLPAFLILISFSFHLTQPSQQNVRPNQPELNSYDDTAAVPFPCSSGNPTRRRRGYPQRRPYYDRGATQLTACPRLSCSLPCRDQAELFQATTMYPSTSNGGAKTWIAMEKRTNQHVPARYLHRRSIPAAGYASSTRVLTRLLSATGGDLTSMRRSIRRRLVATPLGTTLRRIDLMGNGGGSRITRVSML